MLLQTPLLAESLTTSHGYLFKVRFVGSRADSWGRLMDSVVQTKKTATVTQISLDHD
jgi:hypothetical protein